MRIFGRTALLVSVLAASLMFVSPGNNQPSGALAAASVTSIKSGNWSDPSVWDKAVPGAGDSVIIKSGHRVIYDTLSDVVLGPVSIEGTLYFSRTENTRLKTNDNILVGPGGFLDLGTSSDFIPHDARAEVIWQLTQVQADHYVGGFHFQARDKGLWVLSGGTWEVHGHPFWRTWTKLDQHATPSSTTVLVENNVTDWPIGGTVVVTATNMPQSYYWSGRLGREQSNYLPPEDEVRTIKSLESLPDGRTRITLDQPLQYFHDGAEPIRGEVALLSRNVLFSTELLGVSKSTLQSDVSTRKFAHTAQMPNSSGSVQYAQFTYMGHFGILSRYPIHPHMMLESAHGIVYRGNSCSYTGFRCLNLHMTHGVLVEDNVSFNSQSTDFFVEPSVENRREDVTGYNTDNVFVRNIAIGTLRLPDNIRGENMGESGRLAAFWPGAKTINEAYLGNVAVSVQGTSRGGGSAGFHLQEGTSPLGAEGEIDFTFVSNEARSNGDHGMHGWQNMGNIRDFVDNRFIRNGANGVRWGAYTDRQRHFNSQVLENGLHGFSVSSTRGFVQDSQFVASPRSDASMDSRGFSIAKYTHAQYPGEPVWIVRNTFTNYSNAADRSIISQFAAECDADAVLPDIKLRPVLRGECSTFYNVMMGNVFENGANPMKFGWPANPNSWWKIFDYAGPGELPRDFVTLRADQINAEDRSLFAEQLVTSQSFYSSDIDALITPMTSLPTKIEFTDLLNDRGLPDGQRSPSPDFTFTTTKDYPPQVSIQVDFNENTKVATIRAAPTDDKGVNRVEFIVDWNLVETRFAPPYEISIDLSQHPRKHAFIYARAFDGVALLTHRHTDEAYEQRAYSNVVALGPEKILSGYKYPIPFQASTGSHAHRNQPPVVDAGPDVTISLSDPAPLQGTVSDDGLPNPPGELTLHWSLVSGPGPVSFADPSAATTTASFTGAGSYTLLLTASDGELSASDEVSVSVSPQPIDAVSPIGHWKCDEGSGNTAFDSSGNHHHGAISGGAYVPGVSGMACQLDSPDTIAVDNSDLLNIQDSNQATFTAWVKKDSPDASGSILFKGQGGRGGYTLAIGVSPCNTNQIKFTKFGVVDSCSGPGNVVADTDWHHVAGLADASGMHIFIDGVLVASHNNTGNFRRHPGQLLLGNYDFSGTIDDLHIYNRALSPQEIAALANSETSPLPTNQPPGES